MEVDVPVKVDVIVEAVDTGKIHDDIKIISHLNKVDTKEVPHHAEKKGASKAISESSHMKKLEKELVTHMDYKEKNRKGILN